MNARERLFAALNGEPTDRVPIWLLFPYHQIGCYVDVQTHQQYRRVFEESKKYAIMLNRRSFGARCFAPEVDIRWEEEDLEGVHTRRQIYEYKGKKLVSETVRKNNSTQVKKLIRSDEDLEFYCSLPLNTDKNRITQELESKLPKFMAERAEFPEEYGSMMLSMGEPIGDIQHNCDLEEFSIWSLTHNEMIVDFLERAQERYREIYNFCLDHKMAEVYFMVGSELAAPPMVSRETFQQWIVPFAKELIEIVHGKGEKVIQHFHGQIRDILSDFVTMAPDALHTIEAPPVGNCTFTEAFDIVGNGMTLIGNIQYDEFRSCSPEKMAENVRNVLDECEGKRLILSPSAGPFDENPSERVIENYLAFMKTAWEYNHEEKGALTT
ncbi:MAG: hypothetical protein JXR97_12565 [Planctomycetes bacterium]|nr:hypothetical protein [Planctomycetota bacterium]